jgi:adenylate cyclase
MAQSRQLAAIIFTDIVGYTALMGEDEQKAFELLRRNRQMQQPIIKKFNGSWIKEIGDGVLASFLTVTDAVLCATEIQKACADINDLKLRIGIHQGEVVFEDNDVFGDGVNIASRLQALAPIGGIWVSESVYKNISNKKEIRTKFISEEVLRNVKEPVRVYEIITYNSGPEQSDLISQRSTTKISEKSIAVLPFVNMSSDPEQEYFSDGLTEEIITDLSRLEKLLVISRSSIMTFKGTHKKIKEIANEVNVRYILEGSVRKSGNNLRITAQLIDSQNDCHIWAEKYNGTVEDVFDIQERVSKSIVGALDLKLTKTEESYLSQHPIQNAKAYECYILARQAMWKRTDQSLENAIILAQRGLDLIGDNALLYAIMGSAYLYFHHFAIRPDPLYLEKAKQYACKSLTFDPDCAQGYLVLGEIEFLNGNKQEASHIFKKMLQLEANNTDAMVWLMVTYIVAGRPDAALSISEKLMLVDPLSIFSYQMIGDIKFYSGNIKESLPYFRWWLQKDPETPFVRFLCSNNFALNNELKESINVLDSIIKETPSLIFAKFALFLKSALQGDRESALGYATDELKREAASVEYFPINMAWVYVLIDEKEEAVNWLKKSLGFGYSPYPLLLKFEVFHRVLKDHVGFHAYMEEIKKRSEKFEV